MIPCKNIAIHIPRCDEGATCDLTDKEITANGTYYPVDDDVDGYSTIEVNVPSETLPDASGNSF